jgi:Zn finger protein HypA/HybF involved in hydrogenase expression
MDLPTYAVECNDCRYDDGMFDVHMNPIRVESQGENWVNIEYRCPRCGQRDYSMFPCSLSDLRDMVSA